MKFSEIIHDLETKEATPFTYDAMRGTLNLWKHRGSLKEYFDIASPFDMEYLHQQTISRLTRLPDIDLHLDFDFFGPKELPKIAPIGLGTYDYKGDASTIRQAINAYSWANPVLVDTAETYRTEDIIGEAIKGQRGKVFLATKVARHHQSPTAVRNALERSLKALQVDYIDLYQIHWPSPKVPIVETIGALEDLVDEGKIRFIGVCNFSLEQLAMARRSVSRHDISTIQNRYNLIDQEAASLILPFSKMWGLKFIAYSPLGQSFRLKAFDNQMVKAVEESSDKKRSQIALRWLLDQDVLPIPRSNSFEHMKENLGAIGWSLSKREKAFLENV